MSSEITIPEDVKKLVDRIIARNNLDSTSSVTYNVGSELADGYLSKTVAVDVHSPKEDLNLFVKYALNVSSLERLGMNKIYDNEMHFYNVIAPAYTAFLAEKGLRDAFRNIPRCYGASTGIIVLENLKKKGYELCDRDQIANDDHISLIFKTYARFHAVSFAFKDQRADEYQKILAGVTDIYRQGNEERRAKHLEATINEINNFLTQLDPEKDKFILDRSKALVGNVVDFLRSAKDAVSENFVLLQGDSWCNNMMFKYQDDKKVPIDVMLVDWQIIRPGVPVIDLAYFFYTAAATSKEALKKLDYFMKIYHQELCAQIRKMGSDPDKLYSFSVFEAEWRKFCILAYVMAYMILKAMLSDKDEAPQFGEGNSDKVTLVESFPTLKRNDEWVDRLRNLTEHFLQNEFL